MAERQKYPPKVKCSAKAKTTGQRCEKWAIPGRLQCKLHGGLAGRAGKATAEEQAGATLTLAQAMATNPGRPVWEVILDSIRTVDVLAQAARDEVATGRVTSADGIERVASLARSAHAMASSVMATKALEAYTAHTARWSDAVAGRLALLLTDFLGLPISPEGSVAHALTATLGDFDPNDPDRAPRPDRPRLLDRVGHAVAAALAPRLGARLEDVTAWFGQTVAAVDDGRPAPGLPGAAVAALPAAPVLSDPEPGAAPPAADPEPVLTLHSQAGSGDEAEEIEVVDAELVEPEPTPRRHHTTTLGLGSRRAEPAFLSSYRTF